MSPFERQRLLAALMLLAMALFVSCGLPGAGRWRGWLRYAAIVCFLLSVVAALVEISLWLWAGSG